MKNFACQCGHALTFEDSQCAHCAAVLGYEPNTEQLLILKPGKLAHQWLCPKSSSYYFCKNHIDYDNCNWLCRTPNSFCLSCRLTEIVPNLQSEQNLDDWKLMETAKRRLIYSLLKLKLPLKSRAEAPSSGLGFAFLEDQSFGELDKPIFTGHTGGLITLNLAEADELNREWQRVSLGESYRTLLGHFRHESGHYYFDILIADKPILERFRELFGHEGLDYQIALDHYHRNARYLPHDERYISRYAQSHPLEDWAESWAHYLHMTDTMETAVCHDILKVSVMKQDFAQLAQQWMNLSLRLNALNRSMGLSDAYPFSLSDKIIRKLSFIHELISSNALTTSC